MKPLTPEAALEVWERGRDRSSTGRALALLKAAASDGSTASLGSLTLGERDRRLLELRAATFGPEMTACSSCPHCTEDVELSLKVEDLLALAAGDRAAEPRISGAGGLRFRLPTSEDLLAAEAAPDSGRAEEVLLERCLLEPGSPPATSLALEDRSALAEAMSCADPLAEVTLDLRCGACGEGWQELFEIADFLFEEVALWARSLLREVSLLARGYGWRESDILALSPHRRRAYRELLGV